MKLNIICAAIFFVISFLVIYFRNVNKVKKINKQENTKNRKKKKNKNIEIIEAKFINLRFKIPMEKLVGKKLLLVYALIDSFIMVVCFLIIVSLSWHIAFVLLFAFVILFGLIYSLYEILGRILLRKENEK